MIIAFRNMVMHSTEVPYDDMDNNSFSNSELPAYCSSWETVRDTICHATEFLLTYLKKDTKFTRRQFLKEQEVLLNLEKEMTQDGLLDIYGLRINRFLNVEQLLQMSTEIEKLNVKMGELSSKNLKINVKYIFKEPNDFDLHSKMADEIERHFIESWEDHPVSNGFDIIMNGIHSEGKIQSPGLCSGMEYIVLKFEVEDSQLHQFPEDFKSGRSTLSKEVWIKMETTVQEKLPNVDSIKLMTWELGSIIIYMKLCKKSGELWSLKEVNQVKTMLPTINEEITKNFEGYVCKSQLADSYTFLLQAKNEWGARFLESLKQKPSIILQRFLSTKKLCKCRDSYRKYYNCSKVNK